MSDLFWPGDERAGELFGADALITAMTQVELAWLDALVTVGIAPATATIRPGDRRELVDAGTAHTVAHASEAGGNPVIPLLGILRERLRVANPVAAEYLHLGLTSQDVVDTALMRCSADLLERVQGELGDQVRALRALAGSHRATLMAGRTLGQFAVPITFGLKAAVWLQGVLEAAGPVQAVHAGLRSQFGGAAGTMAATAELADRAGLPDPARRAGDVAAAASDRLGLLPGPPWHTVRAPITRIGDTLVGCTDAWGHIATDVITLSRPEIAELSEPFEAGRGGSSTMPHKQNPVLAVLIRRCAQAAPLLGAQLHLAAADAGDERPTGAWHTEWAALRTLARTSAVAAAQTSELLAGLRVDPARMRATLDAASPGILSERLKLGPTGRTAVTSSDGGFNHGLDPHGYLGTSERTIDTMLERADRYLEGE